MRLFRRRPSWKAYGKLEQSLCWKDEEIARWKDSYARLRNDAFKQREETRRYRTEARQLRQAFSDFVWKQALAGTPEQNAMASYRTAVDQATDRFITELTGGE